MGSCTTRSSGSWLGNKGLPFSCSCTATRGTGMSWRTCGLTHPERVLCAQAGCTPRALGQALAPAKTGGPFAAAVGWCALRRCTSRIGGHVHLLSTCCLLVRQAVCRLCKAWSGQAPGWVPIHGQAACALQHRQCRSVTVVSLRILHSACGPHRDQRRKDSPQLLCLVRAEVARDIGLCRCPLKQVGHKILQGRQRSPQQPATDYKAVCWQACAASRKLQEPCMGR